MGRTRSKNLSIMLTDIYGEGVNIAARMEGLPCFGGGTVGISQSTYLLINRNEIISEPVGEFELKGIPPILCRFTMCPLIGRISSLCRLNN